MRLKSLTEILNIIRIHTPCLLIYLLVYLKYRAICVNPNLDFVTKVCNTILRLTQALWLTSFRRFGLLSGLAEAADTATFVLELPLGLWILQQVEYGRGGSGELRLMV